MIPRICPNCGKQIDSATVCPRCTTNVPPRAKILPLNIPQEHLKLYEYVLPATKDPEKLSQVERKIEQHMEKYKTILSPRAHSVLRRTLYDEFWYARDKWEIQKSVDKQAVNDMLASVNATMNQQSTYKGLGFSAITDTAGAVAYAALDAVQGHIHDVNQSLTAYKKAISEISSISLSSNYSDILRPVFRGIDRVVSYLEFLLESKIFMEEHKDFYESFWSDTKIGGKDVCIELKMIAKYKEIVGQFYSEKDMPPYQLMEAAGYIHLLFDKKGSAEYFCTTGKFETEMLQANFFRENPKIAAEEKKRIAEANQMHCAQAEISLSEGKYFRAATRYAQATENRNALRRSLHIWNQHLLQIPPMERGYLLGTNGEPKTMYFSWGSFNIPYDAKLYEEGVKYKQIYACADNRYVGLSMDGRVYSNAENIYGDKKVSRLDLGTSYLPGNGGGWTQITAIACSGEHLVGLRADGTVCAVGSNTHGQCDVRDWTEVTFIVATENSTAAIRKDGSVLLAGAIAQSAPDAEKWTKMKRLYLRGEGIVGLQEDGQVQAAGKTAFDCQVVSRWRNVVRIDWLNDGIFGIQEAGDVVCDNSDPVTEMLCRRLSGVVKIIHFETPRSYKFEKKHCLIALRADSTIFSFGSPVDFSDWSDIVYVDYHEHNSPNLLAINASGQFLFKGTEFYEGCKEYEAFPHIDTYADWKKQTLQEFLDHKKWLLGNAKGLFASKRRKELQSSIDFLQNELAQM